MDWNDLRHFLALARTGSVRSAGKALGVSHSTVLRRVEALEDELGARLFDRSRDGFSLTRAGRDMVPGAERVEAELAAIERSVVGRDELLEGPISITCSDAWIADFVLDELRPFCDQHPGVQLHLGVDGRPLDLSKREADIALRVLSADKQPPQHLIGMRVAEVHLGTYVAREHTERLDPDRDDAQARWVAFDDPVIHARFAALTPYAELPSWGGIGSLDAMVAAIRRGYGIGMLPTYVGEAEPDLQRLRPSEPSHLGDLWLLSHPDLRTNARLRACRRALGAAFERSVERFQVGGG